MAQFIQVDQVSFQYSQKERQDQTALEEFSFQAHKGEYVAIIGRNGSGKSTLAKLLNGLLLPAKGKVIIDGMDTRKHENTWLVRQKAGLVFQNPDNQIVATTVEEDVAFGLENLGLDRSLMKSRIDEALDTVEMKAYRQYPPHLLSGGQKQRVAIAGIIAMRPEILILDEPTAMLDPRGRKEVVETVEKLNQEGITVIYVTHFMEEVVQAHRVLVMEAGKKLCEGQPADIFTRTQQLEAAGLEPPQIVELCNELRLTGIKIPNETLTVDAMVKALC